MLEDSLAIKNKKAKVKIVNIIRLIVLEEKVLRKEPAWLQNNQRKRLPLDVLQVNCPQRKVKICLKNQSQTYLPKGGALAKVFKQIALKKCQM